MTSAPFLIFLFGFFLSRTLSETKECIDFSNLVESLPHISSQDLNCSFNQDCSSFQCRKKTHMDLSIGLTIISCDAEPIIELYADIPSYGISAWRAKVGDNSQKLIPGLRFSLSTSNQEPRQGYVQINLEKSESMNAILFSLLLLDCERNPGDLNSDQSACLRKKILNEQKLSCHYLNIDREHQSLCRLSKLFECDVEETCMQIGRTSKGECVCNKGSHEHQLGRCSETGKERSSTQAPTVTENSHSVKLVLTFFVLCAALAICVYMARNSNLCLRIRATVARKRSHRVLVEDVDFSD